MPGNTAWAARKTKPALRNTTAAASAQLSDQNQGAYYLGFCCAFGYGTEQDYAAARTYLERVDWDCPDAFYLLGWMYCHGKGGPEDIDKGVALLQKAGDLPEAKEELSHYRQTLFTRRWVRR